MGIDRDMARQQSPRLGQLVGSDLKTNGRGPGMLDEIGTHTGTRQHSGATT